MNLEKIPATVVTGFLGSGKTTLLSNVIRQANGKRVAVIVNEFGELDIDADLLRSCPLDCEDGGGVGPQPETAIGDGIYELANGCICCTVEEEFLPVMKQLVERKHQIDHILIETSGLALPKPLVQAFNWPEVKQHCTVDSVITVVDGAAIARGQVADDPSRVEQQRKADDSLDHDPSLNELLEDQLSSADMVIISKADLLDGNQMDTVRARIDGHVKPEVKMLSVHNGEIDSTLIMGLACASEEDIESVHTHHDHYHDHGRDHHHAHDDFESVMVDFGAADADRISAAVSTLVRDNTILRVKGFLHIPGKPMRQVFHLVGSRIDLYFDRLWREEENRGSRLVFIGKELDRRQIESALDEAAIS